MPQVQCPKCGEMNFLDPTYMNYDGIWKCDGEDCGAQLRVSLSNGFLQASPEVLDVFIVKGADAAAGSDFVEAQRCYNVGAYKAAVVMCRRALESMANLLGANKKTLLKKIEEVYDKGMISKRDFEIATQIRQFGNYGAHAGDDLLGGVTKNDAQTVLEITHHLLRDAYEVPLSVAKLKKRSEK